MTLFQARTVDEARNLLPANGRPVVVVPVYNSYDDVVQCYQAIFRHTPADVALLVVDDGGWDRRPADVLSEVFEAAAPPHDVVVLKQPTNKGFVLAMNDAFEATGRADVVIVNSDVVVGPEWLERLRDAAYSSSTIATSSALTNYGTILSISQGKGAIDTIPGGLSVDVAARRVAERSPQLRPRIPTAVGHCAYVKRAAFDVVGYFDPAFSPGYGEEVDFSQRALGAGFEHVAADDVFVFHRGGSSFGRSPEIERRRYEHEQLIRDRYPYYHHWVRRVNADEYSTLGASLLSARTALRGLHVAIDGLCLGPLRAGTQISVLESMREIAKHHDVAEVTLYAPMTVPGYVTEAVRDLPKVRIVSIAGYKLAPIENRADVAYRAYQVREELEIDWLRSVAERAIVNWLDLIAYQNAAYFADDEAWRRYRDLAKLAGYSVDGMACISDFVLEAVRTEGLAAEGLPLRVAYLGTDHTAKIMEPPAPPVGLAGLGKGFLFCPGVSYLHKNRLFALQVLAQLHELGWRGSLVLAGATPPSGSSLALEAEFLMKHPQLNDHVVSLGMFSEGEKTWLYQNCGLVFYPTTSEGFGLVPFEAAAYGAPCLSSRMGSLDEVLGPDVPTIEEYDPAKVARQVLDILQDDGAAQKLVAAVGERGRDFTWADAADRIVGLCRDVVGRPLARIGAIHGEAGYTGLEDVGRMLRQNTRSFRVFDSAVRWAVAHPSLRTKLVPPGSTRQEYVRKAIDRIKLRL